MPEWKLRAARRMRTAQSPPEQLLWERLRRHALGPRFQRQVRMLGYIADFWCAARRLVVEVDGAQHGRQAQYDARRDAVMREHQLGVLRIPATEVFDDLDGVVARIVAALDERPEFRRGGTPRRRSEVSGATGALRAPGNGEGDEPTLDALERMASAVSGRVGEDDDGALRAHEEEEDDVAF